MSKNGKRIFKNFDPYITSPFGYRVSPINNTSEFHEAVDYGTNNQKLPQYSISNGKVLSIGTDTYGGKFVYVKYEDLGYVGLYYHLDEIKVKVNQQVDTNTIIGITGATGLATGIHLHFGWFKISEFNKSYYDRKWENFEEYEFNDEVKKLILPVKKDTNKYQIEVIIPNLRVRESANGKILGLLTPGYYNVYNKKRAGDYDWYQIGENRWCAYQNDWIKRYPIFNIGDVVFSLENLTLSSTAGYSNSVFSNLKKGIKCKVYKYHDKNGLYMALMDLNNKVLSPAAWTKEFDLFEKENFS